jgi:hypothetical protein
MKPIQVSVSVPLARQEVYDFLDSLPNHALFTDHMLTDFSFSGPERGVGAKVRMRANLPGPQEWMDLEVIEALAPSSSTEETVGAGGRRRTRGSYTLTAAGSQQTDVRFTLEYLALPARERLLAPLLRAMMRRNNRRAMDRLAALLAARVPVS